MPSGESENEVLQELQKINERLDRLERENGLAINNEKTVWWVGTLVIAACAATGVILLWALAAAIF